MVPAEVEMVTSDDAFKDAQCASGLQPNILCGVQERLVPSPQSKRLPRKPNTCQRHCTRLTAFLSPMHPPCPVPSQSTHDETTNQQNDHHKLTSWYWVISTAPGAGAGAAALGAGAWAGAGACGCW